MQTPQRLVGLYLLTVADIRGTSPKVWSAWKGKLLSDLFHATLRMLGGQALQGQALTQARQQQAQVLLRQRGWPAESCPAALEYAGARLLPAPRARRHRLARPAIDAARGQPHSPVVRARPSLAGEGVQVLVYAPDTQDLFARICGYFDQANLSILHARIYTSPHGHALDTFQVLPTQLEMEARTLSSLIEARLPPALAAATPLPEPVRRQPSRRARSFPIPPPR